MVFVLKHGPKYKGKITCPICGAVLLYTLKSANLYQEIKCPDCERFFSVIKKENINDQN